MGTDDLRTELVLEMIKTRRAMRWLWGSEYEDKIKPFKETIVGQAEAEKCNPLEATLGLVQAAVAVEADRIIVAMFFAAYCEVTEDKRKTGE